MREGGERTPTGDEQCANVSRLDLVGERDRGDLPEHAWKLGPALRRRGTRLGRRRLSPAETVDNAPVEVHAAGAIERARRDEDDPAEPLREHTVAGHRHSGPAMHRDASGVRPHIGNELFDQGHVDVGRRRGPLDREPGERGAQRGELPRVAVRAQLTLVRTTLEQRVGQRREHRDVGARPDGHVRVGPRRGFCPAGIEHPHPPAPRAVLAQVADRVGDRGAVAVGNDGVGAHEDRQAGGGRVPHRVQHRLAAHERGGDERGGVVDRDGGDERATPDRREPLARRDLARGVVRESGCQIEGDRVGPVRVDDPVDSFGEVGDQLVPGHAAVAQSRVIEAARRVMPRGEPAALRAHVAAGHWIVLVAAHAHDLVAVDAHDDAARRRADPAVRELVAMHARTLRPGRHGRGRSCECGTMMNA